MPVAFDTPRLRSIVPSPLGGVREQFLMLPAFASKPPSLRPIVRSFEGHPPLRGLSDAHAAKKLAVAFPQVVPTYMEARYLPPPLSPCIAIGLPLKLTVWYVFYHFLTSLWSGLLRVTQCVSSAGLPLRSPPPPPPSALFLTTFCLDPPCPFALLREFLKHPLSYIVRYPEVNGSPLRQHLSRKAWVPSLMPKPLDLLDSSPTHYPTRHLV